MKGLAPAAGGSEGPLGGGAARGPGVARDASTALKSAATEAWASVASLRAGEGTRTLDVHLGNRLAFDLDWPSCIPNAVESTEVVLFVPCVSPYFRTRYGSCEAVVNETQPGEARAWPGPVVLRELLKWRGYGLMRFSGQVDGHVLRAWTPCV